MAKEGWVSPPFELEERQGTATPEQVRKMWRTQRLANAARHEGWCDGRGRLVRWWGPESYAYEWLNAMVFDSEDRSLDGAPPIEGSGGFLVPSFSLSVFATVATVIKRTGMLRAAI